MSLTSVMRFVIYGAVGFGIAWALLGAFGGRLRAGEIVITGALVPPIPVSPGDRVEYELHGLGRLSIEFGD